jgi:hypothetical protein
VKKGCRGAGARSRHPVERASHESELGRGRGTPSSGPRTSRSRDAVEAPRRAGLVRVGAGTRSRHPVERASYESEPERGRGAPSSGPRTSRSRDVVEAPRQAGLVRVGAGTWSRHPVERASYESESGRGRGAPSSGLSFHCGFGYVSFLAIGVGTPVLLVPTVAPEPLGECVITLPEVGQNWSRSVVIFPVGARERTRRV